MGMARDDDRIAVCWRELFPAVTVVIMAVALQEVHSFPEAMYSFQTLSIGE